MKSVAVVLFIWLLQCFSGTDFKGCESPQYLQYRRPGAIHCSFDANISAVFWYDSLDIIFNDAIVTLFNSVKGGQGYRSGEFDITSNGSLLIYEVNSNHGKNYSVATFISLDDVPSVYSVVVVITGIHSDGCDSSQYLEYGATGIIHCRFQTNFYGVFWYNSTETVFDQPILTYTQSVKGGRAYDSGEFDVFPNGSLIIREVRLVHEHTYTVAKLTSVDGDSTYYAVAVIVIVKSLLEGPVIDKCKSNDTICFTELDGPSAVNCIVGGVRPAVSLKWLALTGSGHHYISSKMSLSSNNIISTSRAATLDAFAYSPVLSLLVCKAEFAPGVLQREKSFVLVQNSQRNLSSVLPVTKYAPRGSTLELFCKPAGNIIPYLQVVWKRSFPFDNQYQNLMFGVFWENHFETKYDDHFQFGENGSLILRQVDPQHDGFYGCICGNGITDGMTKYEVVTYVNPVPPYPVVEGCNYESHCVLEVNRKGNLTCSVTGIRPEVKLMWKESNETASGKITFVENTTTVTESGGTFNITLTSSYRIISVTRVTVKCGAFGPDSVFFPSDSTVHLLIVPEPDDSNAPTRNHSTRIFIFLFVLGMMVGVFGGMTLFISAGYLYRKRKTRREASLENSIELCPTQSSLEAKEKLLQEYQKKLEEEQKARTEKQRELAEKQSSHTKTVKKLTTIQADYDKISIQLSSTQSSLEEKEKLLQESQKKLEEEQKARAEKERELAENKSSHIKTVKELTTIQGDYDKTSIELCSIQSSLEAKEKLLQESQNKLEEEQKARTEKERELAERQSSHTKTEKELTTIQADYDKISIQLSSTQSSLEEKEKLLQESQKQLEEEQKARAEKERELAESKSSHAKTVKELTTIQGDYDKISKQLSSGQSSLEEKEKLLQESLKKLKEEENARIKKQREFVERLSSLTKEMKKEMVKLLKARSQMPLRTAANAISIQLSSTQSSLEEKEKLFQESQKQLEEEQKARAEKERELAESQSSHIKTVKELTTMQGDYDKNTPTVPSRKSCNDDMKEEFCPEEYVRQLCSKSIVFRDIDTKFHHEFMGNVLKLASRHVIPITKVTLIDCLKQVLNISDMERRIELRSGVHLLSSVTLKTLEICESGKTLKEEEFEGILEYVGLCQMLEKVTFSNCLLPLSSKSASLRVLQRNHVRVVWSFNNKERCLNLRSGFWKPFTG